MADLRDRGQREPRRGPELTVEDSSPTSEGKGKGKGKGLAAPRPPLDTDAKKERSVDALKPLHRGLSWMNNPSLASSLRIADINHAKDHLWAK